VGIERKLLEIGKAALTREGNAQELSRRMEGVV